MTDTVKKIIDDTVKRCRNFAADRLQPKLRFCKKCMANAEKSNRKEEMFRKAREGLWICPDAKEQCGKKV